MIRSLPNANIIKCIPYILYCMANPSLYLVASRDSAGYIFMSSHISYERDVRASQSSTPRNIDPFHWWITERARVQSDGQHYIAFYIRLHFGCPLTRGSRFALVLFFFLLYCNISITTHLQRVPSAPRVLYIFIVRSIVSRKKDRDATRMICK